MPATLDAETIGARIAAARGRAAMTQAQLASEVSLDRSSLAKIENGTRRVSALELSRIADALDERIEWFIYDAPSPIVSHRNSSTTEQPAIPIDRLIERITRNVEFLQSNDSGISAGKLPQLDRPNSATDAENAADKLRSLLGLDRGAPLLNPSETSIPSLGIFTFSFEMGIDTADAASILLREGAVVLLNGSMQVGRRRLSFAHEVGHCVFADEYSVDWRTADSNASDVWESRIERFARALLLPSRGVTAAWNEGRKRGDDIRRCAVRIASTFRVDMSTLAKRLSELGLVDHNEVDRIRQVRTTRSDIVEMNLVTHDELAAPSIPRIYAESVLRLYRQELISADRSVDLLFDTWSEDDLPELPTLPENSIWQFVS